MNDNIDEIKKKLARFQELWDDALNDNHKNHIELSNLARQIRDSKCEDVFMISDLTESEYIAYDHAKKLANTRWTNLFINVTFSKGTYI